MTTIFIVSSISFILAFFLGKQSSKANNKNLLSAALSDKKKWQDTAEKYKKIAKTRDIKLEPEHHWNILDTFQYKNNIEANFKSLKKDLEKYKKYEKILIDVQVFIIGDWYLLLKDKWQFSQDVSVGAWEHIGPFRQSYIGTIDSVLDEFWNFLGSPKWGLIKSENGKTVWALRNAPICFKIVLKEEVKKPTYEIVYVEVLVEEPEEEKDLLLEEAEKEVNEMLRLVKAKTTFDKQ